MTRADYQREVTLRSLAANAAWWRERGMLRPAAACERLLAQVKERSIGGES